MIEILKNVNFPNHNDQSFIPGRKKDTCHQKQVSHITDCYSIMVTTPQTDILPAYYSGN